MNKRTLLILIFILTGSGLMLAELSDWKFENLPVKNFPDGRGTYQDTTAYKKILNMDWREVFDDPGTEDWKKQWILDGDKAKVLNTPKGMVFHAGPVPGNDKSHAVLWTKRAFQGNLRLEYDYTRLDSTTRYVNILYVLASGSGAPGYPADILEWADKRNVAAMKTYFNHMNLLHISYAAFDNQNSETGNDYIRVRRYLPETGKGLEGTEVEPSYFRSGMFETGQTYHITVIRKGNDLFMHIGDADHQELFQWDLSMFPPLEKGYIGLRQMGSRSSCYRNFKIYQLSGDRDF